VKGNLDHESYFPDLVNVDADGIEDVVAGGGRDKDWHEWGHSVEGFQKFIQYLTAPGDLVVDPCVGGGTSAVASFRLGRKFIGIDIDEESIKMTRLHLESDDQAVRSRSPARVPRLTPARVNARRGLVM
jgi:2-polyprenyl-3-methyl-5-hydroxy-6-metoxy-1,4-benzoquinol methylase